MKKLIVLSLVLFFAGVQVLADDIESMENVQNVNMTPKSTFSGANNNSARNIYPSLYKNSSDTRADFMKPKSIKELSGNRDLSTDTSAPMTYEQFPQNIDSSNMLHMQGLRNGIQNMYMGF